ncbi:MAG: hypothetical protein JO032_14315 [Alphaproteobacteria bacterium]|nr:hypothetical protein [Alphaproteobacteria bacterium]MBV9553954.1 hypothetical protein [Alphaproteobacteria bacterium]
MRRFVIVLGLLGMMPVAAAQTLGDIDRREAAVIEAWAATPLTVRKAFFVAQHPDGFGQYLERPSNVFKPGEKLVAYAEPVGYGWKDSGKNDYEFGFAVDFLVKSTDGKVLTGQENFAHLSEKSHARNREFMVVLTLNVEGAPAGDYVLEYKLHDIASTKETSFDLPFKIAD